MAYPYANAHAPNGQLPPRVSNGARKSYDKTYTNGSPFNHAPLENKQMNIICTPTSGVQCPPPAVVQPRASQSVQVVIPSPRPTQGHSSSRTPVRPAEPVRTSHGQRPVDRQLLLISLAEDYFAAAHAGGSKIAGTKRRSDHEAYYKLIATGLACLEAVLKV